MWDNLGQSAQIFGHCLYNEYDAPTGFDFDSLSTDPPFIVDE